jgi:hypothetical protein
MITKKTSKFENEERISIDDYENEFLKFDKDFVHQNVYQMLNISDFFRWNVKTEFDITIHYH